jgi:Mg-chelatase subunit ChlD
VAAREDPNFLSHLIAWNHLNGSIRDSKVALPVIQLEISLPEVYEGNALAHLALLSPRELLRALRFSYTAKPFSRRQLRGLVQKYLSAREAQPKWFEKTVLQHRQSIKELYALTHTSCTTDYQNIVLFGRKLDKTKARPPQGSVFDIVSRLSSMEPKEAAGNILLHKIPFLVAVSACGKHKENENFLLSLIEQMSAQELFNNSKMLEKLGVNDKPSLRSAYRAALQLAQKAAPTKASAIKVSKATAAVVDQGQRAQLQSAQEEGLSQLKIEGDWLIVADKSGSMQDAIELAKEIAGILTRSVQGQVHLCFVNTEPEWYTVTGLSLEEIKGAFRHVRASGGTALGVAMLAAQDKAKAIDGIILISDGGENRGRPDFSRCYQAYCNRLGVEPPVYWFQLVGDTPLLVDNAKSADVELIVHDLRGQSVDQYSLPNLVKTVRAKRYSLIDEILATPLRTLESVFQTSTSGNVL